jgi:[protein-PII] uridylyltransferase
MSTQSPLSSELKNRYDAESSRLQKEFTITKDGLSFSRRQSALAESIVLRLTEQLLPSEKTLIPGALLLAVGDFGRQTLFPDSGIDLLFLFATEDAGNRCKEAIQRFTEYLGQVGLETRISAKLLSDLLPFDSENAEAILSLLDSRFLAGDPDLFSNLRNQMIPEVMAREAQVLVERLAEMTRNRHRKFANTVFHLVPNVKDGPGGYLDYIMARWLAVMSAMERQHGWPAADTCFSPTVQTAMDSAFAFLASLRCFLHFRHKQDDNLLTWEAQDDAAAQKIGARDAEIHFSAGYKRSPHPGAADWMRIYFHHARAVDHISGQLLEEMPAAQSLFYRQLETWRTGFSNADFSVVDGLILFQKHERLSDSGLFFRTFLLIAQRGFKLSPTAEHQLEQARPQLAARIPPGIEIWSFFQELLPEPHAADALRAMHSLHLLTMFLPEFQGIDALAVRDLSHRFTVDEHTLQAIENLHLLRQSKSKWDERYAGILGELDQPELLYLAILLHDTGKAVSLPEHIPASLAIARGCLDRLQLSEADRETVLFLIERHLDMAATLRRDIFDPRTVAQFAQSMGAPDRLKMLCLFTYADIKAVNPEALTAWKAEDLWQLYISTANYLNRSVDERVHADENDEVLNHLRSLAAAAGKKLQTFLDGLPRRYLRTHPVDEILRHFEMVNRLGQDPVQLALKRSRHWYELTIVTRDRPRLFATVAGALAACGMNIGKAGAFSNSSGTVVDTFSFTDRFRTLEMNLPAWERFKTTLHDVLSGKRDLKRMLRERLEVEKEQPAKISATPQIQFDNECSAHSTLIEIVTEDRPGLLYRMSSAFSDQNCDIDIALIDTEGQTAIDVFYLTTAGGKLTAEHQERLRLSLLRELSS